MLNPKQAVDGNFQSSEMCKGQKEYQEWNQSIEPTLTPKTNASEQMRLDTQLPDIILLP